MTPRQLIAAGLFTIAGSVTAPACLSQAAAANNCGGNTTVHLAPIDCTNTLTVNGVTGGAHLTVSVTGAVHVDAQVNKPALPLFLQVKAHDGISSNAGFNGATAVFVGGLASVDTQMPACTSQIDIKIVPGTPTLDHVSDVYRVAAPLVGLPNCGTDTTTVPQSSTTVPGMTPSSSAPPSTVSSTTPGSSPGPVETTVPATVGGGAHPKKLPATGMTDFEVVLVIIGATFLCIGLVALVARRRAA